MNRALTIAGLAAALLAAPSTGGAAGLHARWDELLQKHVTNGRVDYAALAQDRTALDAYLDALGRVDPNTFTRDDALAFWINAYNAFTVALILDHYPVASIRDIPDPWKGFRFKAAGQMLTLDEMEHKKLREQLKEPRIHFAVVCASTGCPDLWNRAFTPEKLEQQLDVAARRFIGSRKHVRTESRRGLLRGTRRVLYVSLIFKWFERDFAGGGARTVADFIAGYADAGTADFIRDAGDTLRIDYLEYDWRLNGFAGR
jgi:hypothetical protein